MLQMNLMRFSTVSFSLIVLAGCTVTATNTNTNTANANSNTNTNSTNSTITTAATDDYSSWGDCKQNSQIFSVPPDGEDLSSIKMYLAKSADGVTFDAGTVFFQGGGVPSITAGSDGTVIAVFNWFPTDDAEAYNKVASKVSHDNGATWTDPQMICFKDYPEDYQVPFDPTITQVGDGTYRLFFTTHKLGESEKYYYGSATTKDGIHYEFEPGERFSYDTSIVDGSEVNVNNTWYMLAPLDKQNGKAVDAVSTDGLNFTLSSSNRGTNMFWVGNMVNVNGTVRFYGSASAGKMGYSSTTDGKTWSDPVLTNMSGGDVGIALTSDGTYLLFYPEPK